MSKHRLADLEVLHRLVEAGGITPIVERTYSLGEVPAALRDLQAGRARGKLAIVVAESRSG